MLKEMQKLGDLSALRARGAEDVPAGCGPSLPAEGGQPKPLRQQVFERVRSAGQTSRVDVAKDLGISPGSVTQLTSELISAGLIVEAASPHEAHTRGRPPVALRIAPGAGYVVGMQLGDFTHSAVLVDFAGTPICEYNCPSSAQQHDPEVLVREASGILNAHPLVAAPTPAQCGFEGHVV